MAEFAQAEALMQRALRISEKAFGPTHTLTAAIVSNLGLLAFEQHHDAQAARYLERALKAMRDAKGYFRIAIIESHLAEVYLRQGKLGEAKPLLLHSIEIQRRTFAGPHQALAATLSTLAEVHAKGSEREDAEVTFRESIAMFEAAGGKPSPAYVEALQRYAGLLRKSRRKSEAAAVQTRANTAAGFQSASLP